MEPWEVFDEDPLQVFPGVDGVWLEAFEPGKWCEFQDHGKVYGLGGVGAACDFNSC
jgi:hypothetical protein